jgi:hypothetical protein
MPDLFSFDIALPLWAMVLAVVFVALSPLVVKKWRGPHWH